MLTTRHEPRKRASGHAPRRRAFRCSRGERGQGIVEMGFLLPLFLVIIVGVVEVADGLNAYTTIVDSARDGARLGSKELATDN